MRLRFLGSAVGLALGIVGLFWPPVGPAVAGEDTQLEASILRVKPGVVLISSEVGADVLIRCGTGPAVKTTPDPIYETGSGFIIHPDGFIATNGHVVERFYEMNEAQMEREFMSKAAAEACGSALAMVPEGGRKERLKAIVSDPANRGKVRLRKQLQVHLSNGRRYSAEVKAYSPAIKEEAGSSRAATGSGQPMREQSGRDVAILKIPERGLPTVTATS
jgi:hypothetical protein